VILPALVFGAWLAGLGSGAALDPVLPVGYEAVSQNPAALARPGQPLATLEFCRTQLLLANNSLTLGNCRDYLFRPAYLHQADKQRLLDQIGPGPLRLGLDLDLRLLHAQYQSFGFAADYQLLAGVSLPRDLCELALWGNELNRTYRLDGFGADTMTWLRLTVAHGRLVCPYAGVHWLDSLRVGFGLSWLHGFRYSAVSAATGELLTTPYAMAGFLHTVQNQADGGDGFGLTMAGSLPLGDKAHFDLVLRDPVGFIFWHRNPRFRDVTYELESLDLAALVRKSSLDSFLIRSSVTRPSPTISTRLPGVLALGVGYQPNELLSAGVLLNLPIASSASGSSLRSAPPLAGLILKLVPMQFMGVSISGGWVGQEGPGGRREHALWMQLLLGVRARATLVSIGTGLAGRGYENVKSAAVQLGLGHEFR